MLRLEKVKNRKGFTLAEVMLVLAILAVLAALVIPNIMKTRRELRQKELDAKAEIIYTAAQNQISKLRSGGNRAAYQTADEARKLPRDPAGMTAAIGPLYFMSSFAREDGPTKAVMTDGVVSSELLSHYWIVEYSPGSDSVYGVFYSEDTDGETSGRFSNYRSSFNVFEELRKREERIKEAKVGYYGGGAAARTPDTEIIAPELIVDNGEKLKVTMRFTTPMPKPGISPLSGIKFTLELSDGTNTRTLDITPDLAGGRTWEKELYLDDLSAPAKRFDSLYGSKYPGSEPKLTPGPLHLKLSASYQNGGLTGSVSAETDTNSLFADGSTAESVKIACGRHLQNLEKASGVTASVKEAVQTADISFDADSKWQEAYGERTFTPIEKLALKTYCGRDGESNHTISGLTVNEATGNAGLFTNLGDCTLKNITLTGASICGGASGALAGTVTGNVRIEKCRVYLGRDDRNMLRSMHDSDKYVWISGGSAGGLVGASDGDLAIVDSFASTVISGAKVTGEYNEGVVLTQGTVGGLIGSVNSGAATIRTSYADSYLYGGYVGGLVGGNSGTVTIEDCYAAGFLTAPKTTGSAAGLAGGGGWTAKRSYTVCAEGDDNEATALTGLRMVYTQSGSRSIDEEWKSEQFCALLDGPEGNVFTPDTVRATVAYNLGGRRLESSYPYPRLAVNDHYGDWAAGFRRGALVYYEKYDIDGNVKYGFDGANMKTSLTEEGKVFGDGYGLIFRKSDGDTAAALRALTITAALDGGTPVALDPNTIVEFKLSLENGKRETYFLYPLPREVVNAEPAAAATSFFRRLDISPNADSYWFNPWFASTMRRVQSDDAPELTAEDQISVRTPRHLYGMSLYYADSFAASTEGRVFSQERAVNYSDYEWANFSTADAPVRAQEPIGFGKTEKPFQATYNGNSWEIMDVSFVAASGKRVGMFARVGGKGALKNVILVTDYDPSAEESEHFLIRRTDNINANDVVYMGVLAGENGGSIDNCAAAGYYVAGKTGTIHSYLGSELRVGGLVGRNTGTITKSYADCPALRISTTDSNAYAGGLVGENDGTIKNCYAIGEIHGDSGITAERYSDNLLRIAGFAGLNKGVVQQSYCAVYLTSERSAQSFGFAPKDEGQVLNSFYLDAGSYTYIGQLRSYNAEQSRTAGKPISFEELKLDRGAATTGTKRAAHHPNTNGGKDGYPFRAVVENVRLPLRTWNSRFIHYGDWLEEATLGEAGVFYWEHETDGTNNGYHISYVGTDSSGTVRTGSTLCTAHNDDGRVADFGYGYYYKDSGHTVAFKSEGIAVSLDGESDVYDTEAAKQLAAQMPGYVFRPCRTRVADSGDYVYLHTKEAEEAAEKEAVSGKWTVTCDGSAVTYLVSPFFANAIQITGEHSGVTVFESGDGRKTDYAKAPGSAGNPWEIRAAEQLQYINWNYVTEDCDQTVGADNYKQFPYLMYTSSMNTKQTEQNAGRGGETKAYEWRWLQTHDVDANPKGTSAQIESFTPIAGAATSTPVGSYDTVLYAWFGSYYDGQSYKLKNLNVDSSCFTVGVFGATAGANMKRIVLYRDNPKVEITRSTPGASKANPMTGAYCLGGLIGLAYDYKSDTTNTIMDCTVAGYTIRDKSTNQQGLADANVGGLIGVAYVNLQQCSAVTDIEIECLHENGHARYGSYLRAGGLTGAAKCRVTDCYTGGEINVADKTVNEHYDRSGNPVTITTTGPDPSTNYPRTQNVSIYIGGVSGSTFYCNFQNFDKSNEGYPVFTNCYTYVRLPAMKGTIRGVSLIASMADRYSNNSTITLNNCYYLDSVAITPDDWEAPEWFLHTPSGYAGGGAQGEYRATLDSLLRGERAVEPFALDNNLVNRAGAANFRAMSTELPAVWTLVQAATGYQLPDGQMALTPDDLDTGMLKKDDFKAQVNADDIKKEVLDGRVYDELSDEQKAEVDAQVEARVTAEAEKLYNAEKKRRDKNLGIARNALKAYCKGIVDAGGRLDDWFGNFMPLRQYTGKDALYVKQLLGIKDGDTYRLPVNDEERAIAKQNILNTFLNGNTTANRWLVTNDDLNFDRLMSKRMKGETPIPVTYAYMSSPEMAVKLNKAYAGISNGNAWSWVTITEGSANIDGKYSFSGTNEALVGKNYPFPTVLTQDDLINGGTVNVHYGEWPQDGLYWEKGRDTLDIFNDRASREAKAQKEFKLYDKKNELGGAPLSAADITIEPKGIVELADDGAVDWSLAKTDDYYSVPLRALKTGTVTVTMRKTIGEKQFEARFVLESTHSLTLTTDPASLVPIYKGETNKLTLKAVSGTDDRSDWGAWKLSAAEDEDARWFNIAEGQTEAQQTFSAETAGERWLAADFTFRYPDAEGGEEYTERRFIETRTLGVLGLADGTALTHTSEGGVVTPLYSELWRQSAKTTGTTGLAVQTAEHVDPALPNGAEFFLYETASDGALGLDALKIDSAVLDDGNTPYRYNYDAGTGEFTATAASPYELTLATDAAQAEGDKFAVRAGTLLYTGDPADAGTDLIRLTIAAHYGEDDPPESYSLTAWLEPAPTFRVDFTDGSDTVAVGVRGNKLVMPDSMDFTRAGSQLVGWTVNGTDQQIAVGSTVEFDFTTEGGKKVTLTVKTDGESDRQITLAAPAAGERLTFTAKWEEQSYTVKLDANGGMFNADRLTQAQNELHLEAVAYGAEFTLPKNELTVGEGDGAVTTWLVTRTDYKFIGWNTERDGGGDSFDDGAALKLGGNLPTPAKGDTVTLYAQWARDSILTLARIEGMDDDQLFEGLAGKTQLPEAYHASEWAKNDWELEGWYTSRDSAGVKVLDADGEIVSNLPGYTAVGKFSLTKDQTLYARWTYKTQAFAPVDALEDGEQYLIIGDTIFYQKTGAGSEADFKNPKPNLNEGRAALCAESETMLGTKYLAEIVPGAGMATDENGGEVERYILSAEANGKSASIWQAAFVRDDQTTKDKNANSNGVEKGTALKVFTLYNEATQRYLGRVEGKSYFGLFSKPTTDFMRVVYGKFLNAARPIRSLECAKWAKDGGGDCLAWNATNNDSSKWAWAIQNNCPQNNVFCYKLQTITIYTSE